MKPVVAWGLLAALAAATAALFWVGPWLLAATLVAAFVVLPRGRIAMLIFVAITIVLDAVLLAWARPGPDLLWSWQFLRIGIDGLQEGAIGGLRISAVVVLNVAAIGRVGAARWLEALRLPGRATGYLAAFLIAAHDVGRDARRLMRAQQMTGRWPEQRWAQVRAGAALVPSLLVLGVERARKRRDALQLAGMAPGALFVPIVAVTALAVAGRLALIALPNISLTYVVVFAGGIAFGPRVGFIAGAAAMALSDVLLSGLTPTALVNIPGMALIGAAGGAMAGAGKLAPWVLAITGFLATLVFSIVSDVSEWLIVPEFRGSIEFLALRLAGGLAFNVVPAVTNAILFLLVVPSVQVAFAPRPSHAGLPP